MTPSLPARVLLQSWAAVLCGAAACSGGDDEGAEGVGEIGPSAGASGATSASTKSRRDCLDGEPQLVDGQPSGMQRCVDGTVARIAATRCRLADLSKDFHCPLGGEPRAGAGVCAKVCDQAPYGRPRFGQSDSPCAYFCATDDDCPAGLACACNDQGIGQCVDGPCRTGDDCGGGSSCRLTDTNQVCNYTGFRWLECIGDEDACVTGADCEGATTTGPSGEIVPATICRDESFSPTGAKSCRGHGAVCGRPISIDDVARVAVLMRLASPWSVHLSSV